MSGCRRCRITGRVQGVWFRAGTRDEALRLGLRGRVRNRDDGSVEVLACGDATALDALHAWLRRGPPAARVETVACEVVEGVAVPTGFEIG